VPFMMRQHTRGLAETKDDDLDGDEEVQACSAWAATWTRALGPGRCPAGARGDVVVVEQGEEEVDGAAWDGAARGWSVRRRGAATGVC
jgi:hypothetical protein